MTIHENSRAAFKDLDKEDGGFAAMELQVLGLFERSSRLSRQDVSQKSGLLINTVTGRVKTLLEKRALVEDGTKVGAKGKSQAVLRLFDPAIDKRVDGDQMKLEKLQEQLSDVMRGEPILLSVAGVKMEITKEHGHQYLDVREFIRGNLQSQAADVNGRLAAG